MEQSVLVPLSVYNSSNNPNIVTKQQLAEYKTEQAPRYHKDTLKKEINQQLRTSASPLVSCKFLQSPRIELSNSNNLILDGIETGVLLKDFAWRLRRKNVPVPDIYFTLLDAASITPGINVNSHAKSKERAAWILFKNWTKKKLQRLYTQGFAAYGLVLREILAKATKLSPSKVREFLHSKTSYTRFPQATRKFKRIRAFARFKDEIWCMDLANVDILAKDNNGVKYLIVRQGLFDRTVDAKGKKTKDFEEAVKTFSKMTTKKKRPKKSG